VALSIALAFMGVAGPLYLVSAVVLGSLYLGYAIWGMITAGGPRWARSLFFASIIYLPALFGALVASGQQ
jgi:protoheme IX farnesyltransferase